MADLQPSYISLGRWTHGWTGAGEFPSTQARSKELWDVEIESFFWVVSGDYDTVAISRGSPRSIAMCKLATLRLDRIRTTLLTAVETFRSEENPPEATEAALYLLLGRYGDSKAATSGIKGAMNNAQRLVAIQTESGTVPLAMYAVVAGGNVDVVSLNAAPDIGALAESTANLVGEVGLHTSSLWVLSENDVREVERDVASAVNSA